jgi:hypothetical protein
MKKKNENENHSTLGEAETKTQNDAEEKSPGNMGRGGQNPRWGTPRSRFNTKGIKTGHTTKV